jgi:hypothetical protein
MASDQLKHMNELSMSETFAPLPLEIDMTKSPTAGAEPAVARTVTPLLTPDSGRAEDARQAGTESLNGNGFYRFQIGDFQATVISDDHGDFPVWPTFVMNISEAELAPVLHVLSPGPIKTPLVERQSPENHREDASHHSDGTHGRAGRSRQGSALLGLRRFKFRHWHRTVRRWWTRSSLIS